jgi:hypothetical protein
MNLREQTPKNSQKLDEDSDEESSVEAEGVATPSNKKTKHESFYIKKIHYFLVSGCFNILPQVVSQGFLFLFLSQGFLFLFLFIFVVPILLDTIDFIVLLE